VRIVVLGAGGRYKTESAIVRAARTLGHQCRHIDIVGWHRRLGRAASPVVRWLAEAFDPEFVILTQHAILAGEGTVRLLTASRHSAFWYFDALPNPDVLRLGRLVGTMYITNLAQVDDYRAAGVPVVRFLPQGVDPTQDSPAVHAPTRYRCDVSFIGSGQYPHRHEVLRAVAGVCNLQIRGPGWKGAPPDLPVTGGRIRGVRFAQAVRGAAISLGANALAAQDRDRASASNRMWKILGCGGFYLGPRVESIEAFAEDNRHCAWYRDIPHAISLVRHYLAAPKERALIAAAGRTHALAYHTYAHRLELLLDGRAYKLP
jgi:spore maturation protein CgeB